MSSHLLKTSRFFTYLSLISLAIVLNGLFFPFITGKALFFRTCVEIALAAFIGYLILNPKHLSELKKRLLHPVSVSVLFFAIIYLLTALLSINPANAFWSNFERSEGALQILHYTGFFILLISLFNTKNDWKKLIWFLLILTIPISLYGLGQIIQSRQTPELAQQGFFSFILEPGRPSGTFGNTSYFGGFLTIVLLFSFWLFQHTHQKNQKITIAILAIIMLIGLYLSAATAALGAFGLGAAIFIALKSRALYHTSKKLYLGAIIGIITVISATGFIVWQSKAHNFYRAIGPRLWTWGSALSGIIEKPFIGWGSDNFPYVFDKYYNPNHFGIESWFDRAHNVFLDYFIAGGVILVAAYILIYFFYYKTLFSKNTRSLIDYKKWSPLFFIFPIIYLIQGLTIFEVLPVYIPLFLFLAFYVNFCSDFAPTIHQTSSSPTKTPELIGLTVIFTIFLVIFYFANWVPLRKNTSFMASVDFNGKSSDQVLKDFEATLEYWSPIGQQEIEEHLFLTTFNIFQLIQSRDSNLANTPQYIDNIVSVNEKWFHPEDYVGVKPIFIFNNMIAKAYELTSNPKYLQRAKEVSDLALKKAPTRVEFIELRAQSAILEDDQKTLKSLLATLKTIRPDLKFSTSTKEK